MSEIEKKHRRTVLLMGAGLIVCILGSFTLGRYPVSLPELLGVLGHKLGLPVGPFWTSQVEAAVWNIRLPRVILSVLVGACLAGAGGAYQGVFQNPMASPDILGASAGAGFGAALAILLGASGMGVTVGAFGCSLLTVALVFTVTGMAMVIRHSCPGTKHPKGLLYSVFLESKRIRIMFSLSEFKFVFIALSQISALQGPLV